MEFWSFCLSSFHVQLKKTRKLEQIKIKNFCCRDWVRAINAITAFWCSIHAAVVTII